MITITGSAFKMLMPSLKITSASQKVDLKTKTRKRKAMRNANPMSSNMNKSFLPNGVDSKINYLSQCKHFYPLIFSLNIFILLLYTKVSINQPLWAETNRSRENITFTAPYHIAFQQRLSTLSNPRRTIFRYIRLNKAVHRCRKIWFEDFKISASRRTQTHSASIASLNGYRNIKTVSKNRLFHGGF